MTQESYADFSIIQKYIDQKKYHDEALKKYDSRISELEGTITSLKEEMDVKDLLCDSLCFFNRGDKKDNSKSRDQKGPSHQSPNQKAFFPMPFHSGSSSSRKW